mmetsp:Transcript_46972/g.130497  ORF Transcript_46972/g.130497 Transcript_46972/m.130497 type:complete len:125 (+) Transcript_46972:20-394(+)
MPTRLLLVLTAAATAAAFQIGVAAPQRAAVRSSLVMAEEECGAMRSSPVVAEGSPMMKKLRAALAACDPQDQETRDEIYDRIDKQRMLEFVPSVDQALVSKVEEVIGDGLPVAHPALSKQVESS